MDSDPAQELRTDNRLSQRIIDAAIDLAEQDSWETVRLHAVAARLGVSLDDIRRVFREKEDIVEALFDRADEAMLYVAEAPGFLDLPTRVRLHRVIMAWLEALAPHRRVTRQMIGGKLEPGPPAHPPRYAPRPSTWASTSQTSADSVRETSRSCPSPLRRSTGSC
jgi:AcrR family transcriptional regulator